MDRVDQRGFENQRSETLSAREAARFLGVKQSTLYSYTSRGLVRSAPSEKGRARVYVRADLERLKARGDARSGHGPVAAGALLFGEPVLATSISSIDANGPSYRGRNAVELARAGASFESVAELLWTGKLTPDARSPNADTLPALRRIAGAIPTGHGPLSTLLAFVPRLALDDPDRFSATKEAEWERARRMIRLMTAALGHSRGTRAMERAAAAGSVAESCAIALGASPKRAEDAIRRALVLLADHELNASTFAARVVASTGADLYAVVTGGLAALSGPRHGAFSDRVEALLDEIRVPGRALDVVQARASRGDDIPGFGHRLYPAGDPRVPPLLELATRAGGKSERLATTLALVRAMERTKRAAANVDLGLVALVAALGLPRGSATALFAIGRTAGWIAHALEQRDEGKLLRPRAEYRAPSA